MTPWTEQGTVLRPSVTGTHHKIKRNVPLPLLHETLIMMDTTISSPLPPLLTTSEKPTIRPNKRHYHGPCPDVSKSPRPSFPIYHGAGVRRVGDQSNSCREIPSWVVWILSKRSRLKDTSWHSSDSCLRLLSKQVETCESYTESLLRLIYLVSLRFIIRRSP